MRIAITAVSAAAEGFPAASAGGTHGQTSTPQLSPFHRLDHTARAWTSLWNGPEVKPGRAQPLFAESIYAYKKPPAEELNHGRGHPQNGHLQYIIVYDHCQLDFPGVSIQMPLLIVQQGKGMEWGEVLGVPSCQNMRNI